MRITNYLQAVAIILAANMELFADGTLAGQLEPVAAAMRSGNLNSALPYTNLLEAAATATASPEDAALCRILETYLLLDLSGTEADGNAYIRATNLCFSAFQSIIDHTNSWQLYACKLSMADALSVDGKHAEAISMKTNLLAELTGRQLVIGETNLWTSLSCYLFESNSLSFCDAVRASAALSKAAMKDCSGMTTFTNGLPCRVVGIVESLLN